MNATGIMALEPLDAAIDHVRGPVEAPVILEYGDYECPWSRRAYREIDEAQRQLAGRLRFAYRHFPLTEIHPHALRAALAAEAAANQGQFWAMHDRLYHRQKALADADLRTYAAEIGLDVTRFDADRSSAEARSRVQRDVDGGIATGQVRGTPTIFIDGHLHRGRYDAATLIEVIQAMARAGADAVTQDVSGEVRDNPAESRYELRRDGEVVGFIDYRSAPGIRVMVHTEVAAWVEGQGIGQRLVAGALSDIRARGLRIIPICPFVQAYLRHHPEQADLVAETA